MKSLPSRLKIALLSSATSGLVLAAFGALIWTLIYDMHIEAVDRDIRTLASRHPGLFAGRGNNARLATWLQSTFGDDYTNHIVLRIQDNAGRILYTSPYWPVDLKIQNDLIFDLRPESARKARTNSMVEIDRSRPGPGEHGRMGWGGPPSAVEFTREPKFCTEKTASSTWRLGALGNEDITLVIGLNQEEAEQELNRLRNAFLVTLPLAVLLVGLGGWMIAGRALRPLRIIAQTAERVTAQGLDQRIQETTESPEAARLIQVLNKMMDRLEASFRQATRFSADASHELKTPLTVMQGELENALQSAKAGSSEQQLLSNLLEETGRLKNITRGLLLLAQADTGHLPLSCETVDLTGEVEILLEDACVLAADLRLAFHADVKPQVRVWADRALLHTAMFNLISNAIKYNEPDGRIAIQLKEQGDKVMFTIGKTGPGVCPADQPKIFQRFFRSGRMGSSRVEGIGLGLSLAREIVRSHGGDLWLEESRSGWTCFALSIPKQTTNSAPLATEVDEMHSRRL